MRDWLAHRVAASPDAEALVSAATGRTWSFEQLDAAADEMVGRLAGLGAEPGDHLAVVMEPRTEYVTLVHAAMRLGLRLVPVGHRLTAAELRPRLDTAAATMVVCSADTEPAVVGATDGEDEAEGSTAGSDRAVPVVSLDESETDGVVRLRDATSEPAPGAAWSMDDPLLMLFTSGTTGEPKLVVLTAGNVFASAVASAFRLGVSPDDRYMAALSFHHTGGLMPLYRAVLSGTSVVLRTEFDAGGVADDVREYDVTGISLVPTMLRRMLDARGTLADSLRCVLLGGAPASADLVGRCRHYSVPVHPTYGMTETASGITVARPAETTDRPETVGRPLFRTDLTVVDGDGEELPPGEVGEFVVDGPTVSPGYYGDPDATASSFEDGALHTGDAGYRDEDGYCYVLNRLDDRIITGGENVDPGEVVAALREHPAVQDAAVVGLPDEEWGERVAAAVVSADPDLDADTVRAFCRKRLADFKRPRTVALVPELRRTDTGTVDRSAVADLLADAVGTTDAADGDGDGGDADADEHRDRDGDGDSDERGDTDE
ncbi:o-succinylbenzoate--CoA ligase [Halorarum halobium]|uniref:o-succinylbenzoate--CoA ligase n=1 Tax=Halorarum halobium TaxID=3075121 RepID=UPI0028A936B7|nr:o-succinylbenzoate--CoA ligase [Halobaculum sp. XH14]